MTLTVVLCGAAALLALAPVAVALSGVPAASRLIYGGCMAASTVSLAVALAHLLAAAPVENITLPLGIPWLGAHFRIDALSAFFLVVVDLGARRRQSVCARLWPTRDRAGARTAVLSGLSCRHEPRCDRRRRLHLFALLGIHVAFVVGAGHGAPPRARQCARRLRLSGHGELRHARAAADIRPAGGA